MERWSAVDEDGRQLATLRIWETTNPQTGSPFMSIVSPSEEDPSVTEEYILDTANETAKNQFVSAVQEQENDDDDDDEKEEELQGDKAPHTSEFSDRSLL